MAQWLWHLHCTVCAVSSPMPGPVQQALTPQQKRCAVHAQPQASPGKRGAAASQAGSAASPGEPVLAAAGRWLALLACACAQGPLPPAALSLMNDLVQLLFYHATPKHAANGGTGPGSPAAPIATQVTTRAPESRDIPLWLHVWVLSASVAQKCKGVQLAGEKFDGFYLLQECVRAVMGAVGARGAMRLWVRLLEYQTAEPTALQWLPLLACWLSDSAPVQPPGPSPRQPKPQHPDGGSSPPQQQAHPGSPARPPASSSPPQPARSPGRSAGSQGEPASSPGRPAGSPGSNSGRPGTYAAGAGEASALPLARSVEEALQLQEAAMRIGYGAAALPLWEAFLARYLAYQARPNPLCHQGKKSVPAVALTYHLFLPAYSMYCLGIEVLKVPRTLKDPSLFCPT